MSIIKNREIDDESPIQSIVSLYDQTSFLTMQKNEVKLWNIEIDKDPLLIYHKKGRYSFNTAIAASSNEFNVFAISDENCDINFYDMRESIVISRPSSIYSSIDDIDTYIHSITFFPSQPYFCVRSIEYILLYDRRKEDCPIKRLQAQKVVEGIETKFDRFESVYIPSEGIISGLYGNEFISWEFNCGAYSSHRASKPTQSQRNQVDYSKGVTSIAHSSLYNTIGLSCSSSLFFFKYGKPKMIGDE